MYWYIEIRLYNSQVLCRYVFGYHYDVGRGVSYYSICKTMYETILLNDKDCKYEMILV